MLLASASIYEEIRSYLVGEERTILDWEGGQGALCAEFTV
jgi:hypothetical protein